MGWKGDCFLVRVVRNCVLGLFLEKRAGNGIDVHECVIPLPPSKGDEEEGRSLDS